MGGGEKKTCGCFKCNNEIIKLHMRTAILFDSTSIQQYVFGSNKMKDNLGASHIVENVFNQLKVRNDLEIGYIGGGNALIFTFTSDSAKKIVSDFTKSLLVGFPGVSIAVAIMNDFGKEDLDYSEKIKNLFRELSINKGKYHAINTIPSHGITDVCRFTSLSVEIIEKYEKSGTNKVEIDLISSATATKRNFEKESRDKEKELLRSAGLESCSFPTEFKDLGQRKFEDSHIAVVHIDGNGFGEIFRSLKTLNETIRLSEELRNAVIEAFIYCLKEYDKVRDSFTDIVITENNKYLPIRPIVLGGDDVTFVCHGKLGIWFAEKFMGKFSSNNYVNGEHSQPYGCCAGIAIVKEKYPFYRAYQLAESLCTSAKEQSRKNSGNWIDFQFSFSGLGNSLDEIRKYQYSDPSDSNSIINRPYCLDERSGHLGFCQLKKLAYSLNENLPQSKIKSLRAKLNNDIESLKEYIEHLKNQHGDFIEAVNTTEEMMGLPFFDMIELLEVYPVNLLNV